MTEARKEVILVYPEMGFSGALVRHLPLSSLYAAVDAIKAGYEVKLLDARLCPRSWRRALAAMITDKTLLVGVTVLTGAPIRSALAISRWVKTHYPNVAVVWGGPHATFNGPETLSEPSVDYVVSGFGARPLERLCRKLSGDQGAPEFEDIPGLVYRLGAQVRAVPPEPEFEVRDFRDIPYHLVEPDLPKYGQLGTPERIFPMYSVMGCPYRCAFCSSPAQYRDIAKKNLFIPPEQVAAHIEHVQTRFGATYIYFIDDDSFVRLDHVERIIDEIERRGLKVRLGFRGARVNEIMKMSDSYLDKLAAAGTNILHIGAESGSQRILDLVHKDCTVDDIIECNVKLARHPGITAAYNWVVGLPGETVGDLDRTRSLILRLLEDNPKAIMFIPNKYRPLPGTELYSDAVAHGYTPPVRLEDWAEVEAESHFAAPWYTREQTAMIHMMQLTSYFVDRKLWKVETGNSPMFRLLRLAAAVYGPVARYRFRSGWSGFPLEYMLFRAAGALLRH